jgi:hypothetical protein
MKAGYDDRRQAVARALDEQKIGGTQRAINLLVLYWQHRDEVITVPELAFLVSIVWQYGVVFFLDVEQQKWIVELFRMQSIEIAPGPTWLDRALWIMTPEIGG